MSVPVLLRLDALGDGEARTLGLLGDQLAQHGPSNTVAADYYEAKQKIQHAGVAIPPEVASRLRSVIGWAGTVVDVLEERLDWHGWVDDGLGLGSVFADNTLDVEAGLAHLDALLYGTAFVRVGAGSAGEPSPLITMHSPRGTTGVRDPRTRRLSAAATFFGEPEPTMVTLDLPDETVTLQRRAGRPWQVTDRDQHRLGRVLVAQLVNRPRASRTGGRSEITEAVRYYCDAAVRTLLGMETNREFYSIPQMLLLGRGPDAFQDKNGNPVSGWRILAGHALAVDKDDDGDTPTVSQLQVGSPAPFLETMRGLAQDLAAEAGMPPSYLGIQTDNPASADAIRAGEARLVKRAERRQTAFGRTWLEVARLALLVRDGVVPDDFASRVGVAWRDAATPTRAAAADEAVKLIGAGVLPPDSPVTYSRIGLTPTEVRQITSERRRAEGRSIVETLAGLNGDGDPAAG